MPQPNTRPSFPHRTQSARASFSSGVGSMGGQSQIPLCVSRSGPCPGLPAAVREGLLDEWVSVESMGLTVRKSGFTHLLCRLLNYLSYSLVISFLICYIEVIITATFLGYWEDRIKHLEEKISVNGKIFFDSKPLEGFLGIHTYIYTYTHIRVGILPSFHLWILKPNS